MFTQPFKPYSASALRSSDTGRGLAWEAVISVDGRKLGRAINRGNGGATYFDAPLYEADALALRQFIATLPPALIDCEDDTDPEMRQEMFLSALVDATQSEARLRRSCKKKIHFRLHGDPPDQYWTVPVPYTPQRAAGLRAKHQENLEVIFNEVFDPPAATFAQ